MTRKHCKKGSKTYSGKENSKEHRRKTTKEHYTEYKKFLKKHDLIFISFKKYLETHSMKSPKKSRRKQSPEKYKVSDVDTLSEPSAMPEPECKEHIYVIPATTPSAPSAPAPAPSAPAPSAPSNASIYKNTVDSNDSDLFIL